jgi:hypothetical protein
MDNLRIASIDVNSKGKERSGSDKKSSDLSDKFKSA